MNPLLKVDLINNDSRFALELALFVFYIKNKVCDVLESFKKKLNMKKKTFTTRFP